MLRQPDFISTVEAIYSLGGSDVEWMQRILNAIRPSFDGGLGVMALTFQVRADHTTQFGQLAAVGDERLVAAFMMAQSGEYTDPETLAEINKRTLGSRAPSFGTSTNQVAGVLRRRVREAMAKLSLALGVSYRDFAAILASEPDGHRMFVGTALRDEHRPTPGERARFSNVAAHVGAGLRLRHALAGGRAFEEAVLAPDGKCLHAEEAAQPRPAREALRQAAVSIDRARGRLRRQDGDGALAIWRALCAGRWSLVDRFDSDGRRFLVARRNDPDVRDPRALSPRERQVAAFVALGHPNKYVAYALGLSTSTVALHLANAMHKLGIGSRARLIELFATLGERASPAP